MGENVIYLTKNGLEKMKEEYESLKNIKKALTKEERPFPFEGDNLNPEYYIFWEDFDLLQKRLLELEAILHKAKLIALPKKEEQNKVQIGSTVTLEDADGKINEFTILSTFEANPAEGKISAESPVGKALLGHKVGEEVAITSPINVVYKIKKIKHNLN
jgi:transcription elongation factor GreA